MGSESVQTLKRDISISRLVKQEKWLGIRFHGKRIIGSIYTLYIHWYNILEFSEYCWVKSKGLRLAHSAIN